MNRLEAMSVLVAVAESGSLSAAGRRLGMPLATVSRKISELEAHIGTRLLLRSSRKLSLTDSGRDYLAACKRILEDIGEAERAASGEYQLPRGELLVAAPLVFGRLHVLPIVTDFLRAYPQVDVRLALSDRVASFWEEHIDAAVRIGELPDSSLVAARVGVVRRVVCASPAYLKGRGTPRHVDDLARHDCVTFSATMSPDDAWTFRTARSESTVRVRSRLVVNTTEAAIDAAIAGAGLTRVPSYPVREAIRGGKLVVVLKKFEPAPMPVSLLHSKQRLLPLKLRAFLDFARSRLSAVLSQ